MSFRSRLHSCREEVGSHQFDHEGDRDHGHDRKICGRIWWKIFPKRSQAEAKNVFSIAWAIILSSFLQFFLQSTSVIMCGHLSAIELDSVALANSLISVLGVHIIGGMSTAFDTFFSQSFGTGNKKAVGIYLQRALILAFLVLISVYCIHLNIEPILIGIGQDRIKAIMASEYITLLLPGLFFDFTFQTMAKYLQNQGFVLPPLLCVGIGNVINVISQYIAIYVYGAGYLASAICQSCSFGVMAISVLGYIFCSGVYKETWDGWKIREALADWGTFMRLALPGILLIAFEAWCFEIGIIIAGLLDTVQMGAQAILFQLEGWIFMFPFGISIAVSIRVGQKMGAGDIEGASIVYRVALAITVLVSLVITSTMMLFMNQLPAIFTKDKEVISVSANIIPIFAFSLILTAIAQVTTGALRGCGHQLIGAGITFVCFYVIGMPLGISLALLTPLKIFGFWIGLLSGTFSMAVSYVSFFVFRVHWPKEVEKAKAVASVFKNNDRKSEFNDLKLKLLSSSDGGEAKSYESTPKVSGKYEPSSNLLFRRSSICGIVLTGFIISVLTRIFVPKSWRPPCLPLNNETILISTPPLMFCNNTDS